MLKRAARWTLFRMLSIPIMETAALRVIRVLMFNYGEYPRLDVGFTEILAKHRMHVVDDPSGVDMDVTFIRYRVPCPTLDPDLLELVGAVSGRLREFQLHLSEGSPSSDLQFQLSTRYEAFISIPELREPDNHYMFLTVLAEVLGARQIVEVGTASGASLCAFLASGTTEFVHTFDLVPLEQNQDWLSGESFTAAQRLLTSNRRFWEQHIADLSDPTVWSQYSGYFAAADVVLVDADHSSKLESVLAARMKGLLRPEAVVIWDDIRVSSMVDFWQTLGWPKLDVGSLGHVSGTGISRTKALPRP